VSTSRVLLFGATGYTGRLTAEAMLRRGMAPLLVGRSPQRLAEVATALGGHPPTAVADADDPAALAGLLREGDVLVTTVGPFSQHGRTAATAALEAGATYLDSTGEAGFLRWLFEELGPRAERAEVAMVPAFGYDYVPGNLAAALALREAGDAAVRVDVGYFVTGGRAALSGGTLASAVGISSDASFGWRSGRLVTERTATRVRSFAIPGGQRRAVSIGGTPDPEAVPSKHPGTQRETTVPRIALRSRSMAARPAPMTAEGRPDAHRHDHRCFRQPGRDPRADRRHAAALETFSHRDRQVSRLAIGFRPARREGRAAGGFCCARSADRWVAGLPVGAAAVTRAAGVQPQPVPTVATITS